MDYTKLEVREPKFKIGDTVTFKSKKQCHSRHNTCEYYYGGEDQDGVKGVITDILHWEGDCYKIYVHFKNSMYYMLEKEMVEYDSLVLSSNKNMKKLQFLY